MVTPQIGTLWSFRGDPTADSMPDQARDDAGEDRGKSPSGGVQEGEEGPHPVSEVRFRSSPPLVPKKIDLSRTQDPLSQKVQENFAALEAIRQEYFVTGTDTAPHGPLFVSIPGHLHVGPLVLHLCADEHWRSRDDTPVNLYAALSSNKSQKIVVAGMERYVLLPRTTPPNPLGSLDFHSDNLSLENWLTALERVPAEVPLRPEIRKELSIRVQPLSAYAEMRLQAALERIEEDEAVLGRVRRMVLELPSVKEGLREAAADAQREAVRAAQESLEQMRLEEGQLSRRVEISQLLLTNLERQTHQASEAAAAASEERSNRFAAQVAEALASATKPLSASLQEGVVRRQRDVATYPSLTSGSPPQDIIEVCKSLRRNFGRWELMHAGPVAMQLTAAWLCGLMPIITGTGTGSFLRAAAAVLTGGRLHVEDVAPSAIEPADLFGRLHPASGVYLPHPSGLSDLFLNESGNQRIHLIAFQGINRCEADGVFQPLVASYQGSWMQGGRRLPLLHPYGVSADDPYRPLASAVWPRNFLPLFVYSSGTNSLPLSPEIWANSVLIIAEGGASGFPAPAGDLNLDTWTLLRAACNQQSVPWTEPASTAERYQEALRTCGASAEMAAQTIQEALILPMEVTNGTTVPADREAQAARVRSALFGGV